MPFNILKKYPKLLEISHYSEHQRRECLLGIFARDIEDNISFKFKSKQIRPIKKEGVSSMQVLYHHLTTKNDIDESGNALITRSFEVQRSIRLHWIKHHIDEKEIQGIEIFSFEDRINGKDKIRTYIYDSKQLYIIILEPQRSNMDYYLITAYYLDTKYGKKQIKRKMKNKLTELH